MNYLDSLPFDLYTLIYKLSLGDHIKLFPTNFINFHLKSASKRYDYEYIKYTDMITLHTEVIRLFKCIDQYSSTTSIQNFQNRLFWISTACNVFNYNYELIKTYPDLLQVVNERYTELFTLTF